MKKVAIAMFVKTPSLSPFKTRLAVDIGEELTYEFYSKSLKICQSILQNLSHKNLTINPYFAVAEQEGMSFDLWSSFDCIFQGTGHFGQRLAKVYQELSSSYDAVIFLGADCPHLNIEVLSLTLNHYAEGNEEYILGRAEDGGFYLFGGSCPTPSDIWTRVQYSQSDTCEKLAQSLCEIEKIKYIESSFDIDTIRDLRKYESLDQNKLIKIQSDFIAWTKSEILKIGVI